MRIHPHCEKVSDCFGPRAGASPGLEIIHKPGQFCDVSLGLHHMDFVSAGDLHHLEIIDE